MITLTVRNGDDLRERFAKLTGCLKRYHKTRQNLKDGNRLHTTEVCKAHGAVWSYEVTKKTNGWHPHVHAIWLCESPPDPFRLSREWHDITGDSFVVDVRPIEGDLVQGFKEVFKYATKFSSLSLADNVDAYVHLKGKRLLGSFGLFHGVKVPTNLDDETLDDEPFLALFYGYKRGVGYELRSFDKHDPNDTAQPVKPDRSAVDEVKA